MQVVSSVIQNYAPVAAESRLQRYELLPVGLRSGAPEAPNGPIDIITGVYFEVSRNLSDSTNVILLAKKRSDAKDELRADRLGRWK